MCEPISTSTAVMMGITAVTSLGGAALQMQGQNQQAAAQRASLNYQRQVAENNARTSELLAEDARERGRQAEEDQRRETAQLLGRQRAVLGATGIDVGSGSALGILGDTAALGELDALQIRDNAAREAWQFETQASNDQAQAGLLDLQRGNVQGATVAPLLSATGQVANRWYEYSLED